MTALFPRFALLVEDATGNVCAVGSFDSVAAVREWQDARGYEGQGVVELVDVEAFVPGPDS